MLSEPEEQNEEICAKYSQCYFVAENPAKHFSSADCVQDSPVDPAERSQVAQDQAEEEMDVADDDDDEIEEDGDDDDDDNSDDDDNNDDDDCDADADGDDQEHHLDEEDEEGWEQEQGERDEANGDSGFTF